MLPPDNDKAARTRPGIMVRLDRCVPSTAAASQVYCRAALLSLALVVITGVPDCIISLAVASNQLNHGLYEVRSPASEPDGVGYQAAWMVGGWRRGAHWAGQFIDPAACDQV
jgi:hypothetical protein